MKVWNYIVIMLTMVIFLEFTGIHTTGGQILDLVNIHINNQTSVLESGDVTQSSFYTKLFAGGVGYLMLVSLGGSIIVGLFTRQFDWKIVLLPFMTGVIVLFASTGWAIIKYADTTHQGWLVAIVATVFLPITAGFIYSIVEWFGNGGDQ